MHPTGTIFISVPAQGELLAQHLPICRADPVSAVSLPVPENGELLLTFMPETGSFLPLQRRLSFRDCEITHPLPTHVSAQIWPNRLTTLQLSPIVVPTNFSVYPQVLQVRQAALSGTTYDVSRIRREVETLLISHVSQPLVEFALPRDVTNLDEVQILEPNILLIPLDCESCRRVLVLRLEPTGWHEILSCEAAHLEPDTDSIQVFSPLPYDPSVSVQHRVFSDHIESALILPASPSDPGYLALFALTLGQMDAAQQLLSNDLSAQDLREYLGHFTRILPPPTALPLDEGHTAWGICGEENPAHVRLFVFSCANGVIQDIYQWE